MAIQIDWGILSGAPDAGAAFSQGYQVARKAKQEQATQDALAAYGANPAGPVPAALWAANPQAAALAAKNSREVGALNRQMQGNQVYANILRGTPNALGGTAPAMAATAGGRAAGSPTDANGDIVVTGATPAPATAVPTVADLAEYDPELASKLTEHVGKLNDVEQKAFSHRMGVGAAVALAASDLPVTERAAFIDENAPLLKNAGWSTDDIAAFDPSDDNIRGLVNIGAGVDKIIADRRSEAGQKVTMRGQDVSASTARRGQDISAATTRRGQDISAASAAAGQAVTMRGQDMTSASREAPKPATVALAKTKLTALDAIDNQLKRVENALKKAKYRGPVAGRIPGGISGADSAADAAIRQLAPLIRQLTRVPGEGAMSDYESRLAEAGQPSRSQTDEGLAETMAGYRDLINATRSGYRDLAGKPTPAARRDGFKVVR
jgi:hypothetical protein